jgi:hypothetical protein
MMNGQGIPLELHQKCRDVFGHCREFESDASLQFVFTIGSLYLYRNDIQSTSDKRARVEQTTMFLWDKYFQSGESVFLSFIGVLRELYERDDARRMQLDELYSVVRTIVGNRNSYKIPVVIAAMIDDEANQLFSKNTNQAHEDLHNLLTILKEHGLDNFATRYHAKREEWNLWTDENPTAGHLVEEIFGRVNKELESTQTQMIEPWFISDEFFDDNPERQQDAWDCVKQKRGVLIVDAISLFYPQLRHLLFQSQVSSGHDTAVLVVSPLNGLDNQVNRLIEEKFKADSLLTLRRFERNLDRRCEIGVGDIRTMKRWLFATLKDESSTSIRQKVNPNNQNLLSNILGRPPVGIEQSIFSGK